MPFNKRNTLKKLTLALAAAGFLLAAPAHARDNDSEKDGDNDLGMRSGMVFTSSNSLEGNDLIAYARHSNGQLKFVERIFTGGKGTGAGLGSQGAVTLSGDGKFAFVVNALSHTLSTFEIHKEDIRLASVTDSGGLTPISVTEHNGLVYVLNAGGDGNVAGFLNDDGQLRSLPDGVRSLSKAGGTAPAQVGFDHDGDVLVVTEKGTNLLTSYGVNRDGSLTSPTATPSSGATPFGFAFDRRDHLFVSEAFGGVAKASAVSSYRLAERPSATPIVVSASVRTTQTAACWVAVTPNGRYVYATNTGSSSVTSYTIERSGKIGLLAAAAGKTPAGSRPIDLGISPNGKQMYVLSAGTYTLSSFKIGPDGELNAEAGISGLPIGTVGLAVN
jgi:6-phosphogluconolactonase (cycloisomerase 2 family)